MPPVARLIDMHKYYDLGSVVVKALRGVTLDIPAGDFIAIMGQSGSGKSTLLNLLGAARPSDAGAVCAQWQRHLADER